MIKTNRRQQKRKAFTLVEALVAITILFTVVTAIYFTWESILSGTRTAQTQAAQTQRERVALRTVAEALSCALMYHEGELGKTDPATSLVVTNSYAFVWGSNTLGNEYIQSISFVARLPKTFMGSSHFPNYPVRRLMFEVVPDGVLDTQHLVLKQWPLLAEDEGSMNDDGEVFEQILARNVDVFELHFWNEEEGRFWEVWDGGEDQLPKMVRVHLALKNHGEEGEALGEALGVRDVALRSDEIVNDQYLSPAVGSARGGSSSGGRVIRIADISDPRRRGIAARFDANKNGVLDGPELAKIRATFGGGKGGSRPGGGGRPGSGGGGRGTPGGGFGGGKGAPGGGAGGRK
tara:strand:+ start:1093 stop:2136 length:1044 start_codon:yes stop_codon:yes gene_type:complete